MTVKTHLPDIDPTSSRRKVREQSEVIAYAKRNPSLIIGVVLIVFLLAFSIIGLFVVDIERAYPLSGPVSQAPSWDHLFGTDAEGRDLLAAMVLGTYNTLKIGLLAGGGGVVIGILLGFMAAYFGGWVDQLIRLVTDVFITLPKLLILVVIASSIPGALTINSMALVVALFAWPQPARQVRSQALSMREAGYVRTARLSGLNGFEIIIFELMPNLLPYIFASFVVTVSAAVLATVGLEALGLGPAREPTLGMLIHWLIHFSAFLQGLWWWIAAPITALVILFVGLFLISVGLDEFSNPRLRKKA